MTVNFERSNDVLEVKNAQEYLDKRRLMDIMDAQIRVLMRRNEAMEFGEFDKNAITYEAVRDYIWLSKSLFFKVDGGEDYWLGKFEQPLGLVDHPALENPVPIDGIQDFLRMNPPWKVEYSVEKDDLIHGKSEAVESDLIHMPSDISMTAFEWVNDFLQVNAQLDIAIGPAGHVSQEPGI